MVADAADTDGGVEDRKERSRAHCETAMLQSTATTQHVSEVVILPMLAVLELVGDDVLGDDKR